MPFWDRRAARQDGKMAFLSSSVSCLAEVSSLHNALLDGAIKSITPKCSGNGFAVAPHTARPKLVRRLRRRGPPKKPHYITSQVAYHPVGIYERKGCKDKGLPPRLSRCPKLSTTSLETALNLSVSSARSSSSVRSMWICTEIGETRL